MTQMDAIAATRAARQTPDRHIVDVLIEERAPHLSHGPAWPVLRPVLYGVLNYSKAVRMADEIAPMGGRDALESISKLLHVKRDSIGDERIPRAGAFLILANHPTGITDGVALYDALKLVRPDTMFYANSDAERVCKRFNEVLIPV